ncbi:sensor histidine kinase [Candidatus Nitrospira allomarina]|uniref:histidine kinase n=1 Tax=Candidatus Nitrospira allomarina TaxID=3020900 RepID=A0AA96GAI7_9BACT|nr:ATP-binding protein [Candidatus Nitrospira allomarina]WNM57966.1 ATP-binding protein [Candidatus Nitrospira allomarina]
MSFKSLTMGIPTVTAGMPQPHLQKALIVGLALGIFVADCLTPLGVGMGSLYILVVVATFPLNHLWTTRIAIIGAMFLIILGYWGSISRLGYETAVINRSLSTLCVLVTGYMTLKNISSRQALQTVKEDLEVKYGLQTKELKEQNQTMSVLLEDLKLTKNDLEDKERRLRVLVDAFPSGMLIVDHLGKVIFANKLIETLFGYAQHELVDHSIDMLVPQRYQKEHFQHRADFFHHPSSRAMGAGRDLFARRKDGTEFPVEIGLNPINTPDGFMVLSSIVDISARKQHEAELKRLNQQLANQNQELEAYNYAVSHDLRTPLRAIHNYADFLLEDLSTTVSSEQTEYLNGITTAVCEAEELVSDLLELSRLNIKDSIPQVCHVGNIIAKTLFLLNFDKNVEIHQPAEWPRVLGHEHLLKQIFQNLLANGVKFNHSSPKVLNMNWKQEPHGMITFTVKDNGIGISEHYQDKIFQVFERLHTNREYEGTGIGLAIVKNAVSRLGGEIRVKSELGKGSIFSFTVPIGENYDDA